MIRPSQRLRPPLGSTIYCEDALFRLLMCTLKSEVVLNVASNLGQWFGFENVMTLQLLQTNTLCSFSMTKPTGNYSGEHVLFSRLGSGRLRRSGAGVYIYIYIHTDTAPP